MGEKGSRRGLLLVVAIVVIAVVLGVTYLRASGEGPPFLSGLEPMPEPVREDYRSAETVDGTKYWPRSAPLTEGVQYHYNTGHCGLEWMTDFGGSFWTPHVDEGERPPDFFINEDEGTLTVISPNRAIYRSADGGSALLTRHEGPLVVEGACA